MTQNEYMMTALSIASKVQSVEHKCGRSEVHYILNATDWMTAYFEPEAILI